MPIEDKNGCLHSEENGKFVYKTDPEIMDALCRAFKINAEIKERRKALCAKISKEMKLIPHRNWVVNNFENIDFNIQTLSPTPSAVKRGIWIQLDHWSQLQVMFSDYNRGASKPIEDKNGIKYFNVDNTLYFTEGDYPYFRVYKLKNFRDTFRLERYLKKIK